MQAQNGVNIMQRKSRALLVDVSMVNQMDGCLVLRVSKKVLVEVSSGVLVYVSSTCHL